MKSRKWIPVIFWNSVVGIAGVAAIFSVSQNKSEDERVSAELLSARLNLPLFVTSRDHPVGDIRVALENVDVDPENVSSQVTFFRGKDQPNTLTESVIDLGVNHRTSQISHEVFGNLIYSNYCEIADEAVTSRVVARKADDARSSGWDIGIEGLDEVGRAQCRELYRLGILTSAEVLTGI